jgi:hypothetical protein
MYGIDVGTTPHTAIDWARLRACGRTFAVVRAANGRDVDPGFAVTWEALHRAGIVCGAAQLLRHDDDPVEQAATFLEQVHLERGDLPPMLDLQHTAGTSSAIARHVVDTWIKIVESELEARHGCTLRPIIRTSNRTWPLRCDHDSIARDAVWLTDLVRFQPCTLGDRGRRVVHVKQLLRAAGFGLGVTETTELDEHTHIALLRFQASRALLEDGIVGPKTFAALHWPGDQSSRALSVRGSRP